jgi:hypothetical protein
MRCTGSTCRLAPLAVATGGPIGPAARAWNPQGVERSNDSANVVEPHRVGLVERLGDLTYRIETGGVRIDELALPVAVGGLRAHPLGLHRLGRPDDDHGPGGVELAVDLLAEGAGRQEPPLRRCGGRCRSWGAR